MLKDIQYGLVQTGIFCDEAVFENGFSRAEAAQLLYCLKEHKYEEQPMPEALQAIDNLVIQEQSRCIRVTAGAARALSRLPQKYIDAFNAEGWTLVITPCVKNVFHDVSYSTVGATSEQEKMMALGDAYDCEATTIHEFAHFIHIGSNIPLTMNYIYDTERDGIVAMTRQYAGTCREECFAVAFEFIMSNRDNPELYAQMQERIPLTLAYIERGFLDTDAFCNYDALGNITLEKWELISAS